VADMRVQADAPAPVIVAIAGASGSATLELLSPAARVARAREMGTLTRWLWVATAAALFLAFAIERWGVGSALDAVQHHRSDISAQVSNAVRARGDVEGLADAAAALAEYEAASSRASGVISAVAIALPAGTSLTTLSVNGDSVTVEGESRRSAAVYDALRAIPTLDNVRLTSPLRQERQAGDVTVERFAFNARVRTPTSRVTLR
jgi:Tfp pilus assembly protein PilN